MCLHGFTGQCRQIPLGLAINPGHPKASPCLKVENADLSSRERKSGLGHVWTWGDVQK